MTRGRCKPQEGNTQSLAWLLGNWDVVSDIPLMEPYYQDDSVTVHQGDCLDVLRTLPDASVDAVVTDPPYDLTTRKKGGSGEASASTKTPYGRARIGTGNGSGGFMGSKWDDHGSPQEFQAWCETWAAECLRVLKPGGHLLAFGGTRTYHRLACAIEDAGFEIRDSILRLGGDATPNLGPELHWIYGSG